MSSPPQEDYQWPDRATVSAQLRASGLRATTARVGILSVLQQCDAELGAEDMFRALLAAGEAAAMGTIYRVLHELQDGLLVERRLLPGLPAKALYRLVLVVPAPTSYKCECRNCGAQITLPDPVFAQLLHHHARTKGFDRQLSSLIVTITCNACADSSAVRDTEAGVI